MPAGIYIHARFSRFIPTKIVTLKYNRPLAYATPKIPYTKSIRKHKRAKAYMTEVKQFVSEQIYKAHQTN